VRRAVVGKYVFANHDRSAKQTDYQHIGEVERGALAGFPDTTLWWGPPASVFPCELKRPGGREGPTDKQEAVGADMVALGHSWAWARTVVGYGERAEAAGVPLLPNWRTVAAHEDELVAADIRKQEAKRDGLVTPRKPFTPKPAASRVRRMGKIRGRVMF
jgi:hypothetical protein